MLQETRDSFSPSILQLIWTWRQGTTGYQRLQLTNKISMYFNCSYSES